MSVTLVLHGHGYIGAAGKGGEVFHGAEDGPQKNLVWYKIKVGLFNRVRSAITGGDDDVGFGRAYLSNEDMRLLKEQAIVVWSEEQVKHAGMGDYCLWLEAGTN